MLLYFLKFGVRVHKIDVEAHIMEKLKLKKKGTQSRDYAKRKSITG